MKGVEATAGSIEIRLKNSGISVPINVATVMLRIKDIDTIMAISQLLKCQLNRNRSVAIMHPKMVPMINSLKMSFNVSLDSMVPVDRPRTIMIAD